MKIRSANKHLLVLFLLIASLAFTSAATANLTANTEISNLNVSSTPKISTTGSKSFIAPEALIADLYKQHDAQKGPFFQNKSRALVDKYFTKRTADLIWKDATRPDTDEVGSLDGDPLYDTQDAEVKKFAVGKASIQGASATVPVTFVNLGEAHRFNIILKQENSKWKIDDIKYDAKEGYTLVSILSDVSSNMRNSEKENTATGEF